MPTEPSSLTLKVMRLGRGQHAAAIGQTGTGKSVLCKELIPPVGKVAIINPKRLFHYPGMPVYTEYRKLLREKPARFVYSPKAEDLDNLAAYDAVYKFCYEQGDTLVYTDDVIGIMDKTRHPKYFAVCYQMGREHGVAMLSSFQRPTWLPLFCMSESSKFYIFRVNMSNDIDRINEFVPAYDPAELKDKHTFMFYDIYDSDRPQQARVLLRN